MRNEKGNYLTGFIGLILIVLIFIALLGTRFDFQSGSHRITPTSIDQDFWGNYKVYFKTSEYTQNSQEDFYYIEKDNVDLVEQIKECVKNGKAILVYYDKYIGWKGITAPSSAPIVRIEMIEEEN